MVEREMMGRKKYAERGGKKEKCSSGEEQRGNGERSERRIGQKWGRNEKRRPLPCVAQ